MKRTPMVVLALALALGVAGCAGNTDPASHIRSSQAQLNAHGHTNKGPARFWWEYGTSQSAVQNGTGTNTPHQGPASSSSDIPVSTVVKSLTPATTYYFRACGQDTAAGSSRTCGQVLSFSTAPADSTVSSGAFGQAYINVIGATNVPHSDFRVGDTNTPGHYFVEDDGTFPNFSALVPGPNCSVAVVSSDPFDHSIDCTTQGVTFVQVSLGDFNDQVNDFGETLPVLLFGNGGADAMVGSSQNDTLYGGAGDDQLGGNGGRDYVSGDGGIDTTFGGGGDDTLYAVDGQFFDKVDCGSGTDVAYVDYIPGIPDEYNYAASHGCETVFASSSAARSARAQQAARVAAMRQR